MKACWLLLGHDADSQLKDGWTMQGLDEIAWGCCGFRIAGVRETSWTCCGRPATMAERKPRAEGSLRFSFFFAPIVAVKDLAFVELVCKWMFDQIVKLHSPG
ncbi:hypothetical protein NL676_008647 [Syzygium grande]|nr:hypothetical protein NL676_008647 [Syzygium grande]